MSQNNASYQERRKALGQVARETVAMTPQVAAALPHLAPTVSETFDLTGFPPLDAARCPRFTLTDADGQTSCGTLVRVVNYDSFDAAIRMPRDVLDISIQGQSTRDCDAAGLAELRTAALAPDSLDAVTAPRPAVLNMASEKSMYPTRQLGGALIDEERITDPGGGWLGGAAAQEEALCFRSTLAASLHRRLYPIATRAGLYTRDVIIFRKSISDSHAHMMPETPADTLPVVSVLTVAGVRRPAVNKVGDGAHQKLVFANAADRSITKDKMRLCLRMAAFRGHAMLVLGALGCGAFKNPPEEVAACWKEVLCEPEFSGGWFKMVWFAVYDRKNDGNFPIFKEVLDGKTFGVTKVDTNDKDDIKNKAD